MAYTPPDAYDCDLIFTSPYTVPDAGELLTLRFGTTGVAEILTGGAEIRITAPSQYVDEIWDIISHTTDLHLIAVEHEVTEYSVIETGGAEFRIESPEQIIEHLPDIEHAIADIKLQIQAQELSGGLANNLPNKVGGEISIPWLKSIKLADKSKAFLWEEGIAKDTHLSKLWKTTEKQDKSVAIVYDPVMEYEDTPTTIPWGKCIAVDTEDKVSYNVVMDYIDKALTVPWDKFLLHNKNCNFLYTNLQASLGDNKDSHLRKVWGGFENVDKTFKSSFLNGALNQIKDSHHGTFWGEYWYSLWCQTKYFPHLSGEPITFDMTSSFERQPLQFIYPNNPRCPYDYWYTGQRDSPVNPPFDPISILITPNQGAYYMLNSAYIKRIPSNEDIEFQSLSMSIDRDSWVWSFSITLSSRDYLNLVKPSGSTLIDLQITVNGWKWTCRVENWTETISFGQKAWTIQGRSPSIELGEPYLIEDVFSNAQEHGGQIVNSILDLSGWTADWDATPFDPYTEWLLSAGALNLYDSSKIKQMQACTEAVEAFIQTNANTYASDGGEQKFIIKPKYKENPWNWTSAITPDIVLNDGICHEIGRSNEIIKIIDSVIVSGSNNGIVVSAVRDGYAGSDPAAMIVNSLISTQQAGREKARHVIGNSGFWIAHSLKLFSLLPPETAPGLILPGKFIEMQESGEATWLGQVKSTNIDAAWGNAGLVVHQNIGVEQYYE